MLRVYLDQNHWIALSAARQGTAHQGRDVSDVLRAAQAAVDAGTVSFPLGMAHYLETANRRSWPSRRDLADTMAALSRFQAIAPQPALIAPELDRAFARTFGRPQVQRCRREVGRTARIQYRRR